MRYLPLTNEDREDMRSVIGVENVNQLFSNVPNSVSLDPTFNLPNHKTEMEVGRILSGIANKNMNSNQLKNTIQKSIDDFSATWSNVDEFYTFAKQYIELTPKTYIHPLLHSQG